MRGGCGGIVWWRKRRKKRFNTEGTEEERRVRREFEEHSQEWLCHVGEDGEPKSGPAGCRRYAEGRGYTGLWSGGWVSKLGA